MTFGFGNDVDSVTVQVRTSAGIPVAWVGAIVVTGRAVRLSNVGGVDCIGLGTDFDGFTDPPDDLKDHSRVPDLIHVMQENGFSAAEVEKIVGGNARRVLADGWGRN